MHTCTLPASIQFPSNNSNLLMTPPNSQVAGVSDDLANSKSRGNWMTSSTPVHPISVEGWILSSQLCIHLSLDMVHRPVTDYRGSWSNISTVRRRVDHYRPSLCPHVGLLAIVKSRSRKRNLNDHHDESTYHTIDTAELSCTAKLSESKKGNDETRKSKSCRMSTIAHVVHYIVSTSRGRCLSNIKSTGTGSTSAKSTELSDRYYIIFKFSRMSTKPSNK